VALLKKQIIALLWLRFRLWKNQLRSLQSILETLAGALTILGGILLSILLAGLTGLLYYSLNTEAMLSSRLTIGILLGLIGGLGILLPVIFGEARMELHPGRLLNFPVTLGNLFELQFGLSLLSGANLILYPSLLFIFGFGIITSTTAFLASSFAILLFLFCLITWQQMILSVFRNLLQNRRIRELAMTFGFIFFFGLSFFPALMDQAQRSETHAQAWHWETMGALLKHFLHFLPPNLAAEMMTCGNIGNTLISGLGLALWGLGGLLLTWLSFRRMLIGKNLGSKGKRSPAKSKVRGHGVLSPLALLPSQIAAVSSKHLKYFLRSTAGRSTIPVSLVLAFVVSSLGHQGPAPQFFSLAGKDWPFLLLCFLAGHFASGLPLNTFMWDGPGIETYFTSPSPQWKTLLGYNIAGWILNILMASLIFLVWLLVNRRLPGSLVLFSGVMLWLGSAVLTMITGNFLSILFPHAADISSLRNKPSKSATLASLFLGLPARAIIVGPILLIFVGHPSAGLSLMLFVLFALVLGYGFLLPIAGNLMLHRREQLIETLRGKEA